MINFIIGLLTGVISGFGIGGGSLLVIYLTNIQGVSQLSAAGINLIYFLFCAPAALFTHIKNKLVDKKSTIICVISGVPSCIIMSLVASNMDTQILRRLFGMLVLYVGAVLIKGN